MIPEAYKDPWPAPCMQWIVSLASENIATELRNQAVRMLLRINSLQNRSAVDDLVNGKLNNDAVHVLVAIQLLEL